MALRNCGTDTPLRCSSAIRFRKGLLDIFPVLPFIKNDGQVGSAALPKHTARTEILLPLVDFEFSHSTHR